MTLRNFLTVACIIEFIFGIGFVLIPAQLLALYGVSATVGVAGVFLGRHFGSAVVPFGVLNWLARDFKDAQGLRAVVLANLVGDVIGLVIALYGQLLGVGGINALGWSIVVIYLLLALGWCYFLFMKPSMQTSKPGAS